MTPYQQAKATLLLICMVVTALSAAVGVVNERQLTQPTRTIEVSGGCLWKEVSNSIRLDTFEGAKRPDEIIIRPVPPPPVWQWGSSICR